MSRAFSLILSAAIAAAALVAAASLAAGDQTLAKTGGACAERFCGSVFF
jgi:hypothetical protein